VINAKGPFVFDHVFLIALSNDALREIQSAEEDVEEQRSEYDRLMAQFTQLQVRFGRGLSKACGRSGRRARGCMMKPCGGSDCQTATANGQSTARLSADWPSELHRDVLAYIEQLETAVSMPHVLPAGAARTMSCPNPFPVGVGISDENPTSNGGDLYHWRVGPFILTLPISVQRKADS